MSGATTAVLATQAFGGALSTVGSYYNAKGQQTALDSQASMDDVNARLSELTAQSALSQGQREEQKSRLQTANLKGSQRARLAANGVDLGSGSAVNVLSTTDVMGEIDANTIAANAARSAWGYRTQATNYQNDALMKRASSKAISPWMAAGSTLLTSASSLSRDRYLFSKFGVGGSTELPWQSAGNNRPAWMGGGKY